MLRIRSAPALDMTRHSVSKRPAVDKRAGPLKAYERHPGTGFRPSVRPRGCAQAGGRIAISPYFLTTRRAFSSWRGRVRGGTGRTSRRMPRSARNASWTMRLRLGSSASMTTRSSSSSPWRSTSLWNSSMAGNRRTIPSMAPGKTVTPRTISMSPRRPRMPPGRCLNGHPHRELGQMDSPLAGHFHEMERVGGRADERRRPQPVHPLKARRGVLATARDRERAQRTGALESRPEADEEPEREGKEDAVGEGDAGGVEHEAPAPDPPIPGFLGVEPPQGLAAGARRLVHANEALQGIGQVGPEGRPLGLILDELALLRQRQTREVIPVLEILDRADPRRRPRAADEGVARPGRQQLPGQPAEFLPLELPEPLGRQRLHRAIEHLTSSPPASPRSVAELEALDLAGGRLGP